MTTVLIIILIVLVIALIIIGASLISLRKRLTQQQISESSLLMLQNQTKMISEDLGQASFNLPTKDSSGKDIYPGTKALDFYTSYSNPSSPNYTWNPQCQTMFRHLLTEKSL